MGYIIFITTTLWLHSCSYDVKRDYSSDNYKAECNKRCQIKYKTDVSWVDTTSGDCYCK